MPRRKLNVDGGKKGRVRKRGPSSPSPSLLMQSYRLKRALLVGKKRGSTTPVPMWKMMMSSETPSVEVEELSVSARKLAAILWEINGVPSPRGILEDSELGSVGRKRILESSKRKDPPKQGSHGGANSAGNCSVQPATGLTNRVRDMYNGLRNSEDLLKVLLRHLQCAEQLSSTSLSVVSALEFELDRACTRVENLIQARMVKGGEIDLLLRQFEIARELEMQKKLRRRTEELNEKLRTELSQAKASLLMAIKELEAERKDREMVEYVCDELARGVGENRAEVEQLKRLSGRLRDELEKEREMLRLADMLREERVQMKLSEAKYLYEEKNAVVDGLWNDLEAYLKSKPCNEQGDGCPRYRKIVVLEKYLRETFPGCDHEHGKEQEDYETMNKEDEDEDEDEDSDESDFCSIELNMDDIKRSFIWGGGADNDKSKGQKSTSGKTRSATCQDNSDGSGRDMEDEMKRYRMIKDLRDHVVSGSRAASSQDLSSPRRIDLGQQSISPKDADAVECHG